MPSSEPIVSEPQIQVRFKSRKESLAVPEHPILVPTRLKRFGLSEIINHLLGTESPIPFEFLVDGKFLKSSLSSYLESHSLSTENILDLEYIESTLPPKPSASFPHDDWISSVQLHKKQPYILTGCYDGKARIWDHSGTTCGLLAGHSKPVKSVSWLSTGNACGMICLIGGMDQKIMAHAFDAESKSVSALYECIGHVGSVEAITPMDNMHQFATASADSMIKLWSTSMDDLTEQEAAPVAVEGKKRKVAKKSVPVKQARLTMAGHVGTVSSIVYNSELKHLYSGGYDHSVRTWDLDSASNISTMNCECVVLALDYSPSSQLLVSGHSDNLIRIWDPRAQDGLVVKMKFSGHSNWVSAVSWCPSSMLMFASASYDGSVRVWDMRSSSCMYSLKAPSGASVEETPKLLGMDWSGDLLSTGGEDGELYNYSTTTSS